MNGTRCIMTKGTANLIEAKISQGPFTRHGKSAIVGALSWERRSREARQRWASVLVILYTYIISTYAYRHTYVETK